MIIYDLQVTKVEPNELYEEQMKSFRAEQQYNYGAQTPPSLQVELREIRVRLTEAEYAAIKQAVMEVWK